MTSANPSIDEATARRQRKWGAALVVLVVALVAALVASSLALTRRLLTPSRILGRAMRPAPTAPPAVGEFGEFVALYGACFGAESPGTELFISRGGAWVYLRYAAAGRYGNAGCLVTGALAPGATVRAARDVTVSARFGVLPCEGCVEADDFDGAIRPHVTGRCP